MSAALGLSALLLVGAAVDGGPAGEAAPTTVQVRVEPDPVPFAEPFHVVIEVVRPRGQAVVLPATLPEKKSVRRAGPPRRTVRALEGDAPPGPADERVREIIRVPFVALDLEDVETPAFVLTTPGGQTLEVPGLPVDVDDGSDAGPGGPAGPGQEPQIDLVPESTHHLFEVPDPRPYVALGSFSLSLFALGLLRVIERRRRVPLPALRRAPTPQAPRRPAHEVALERLEALLAEQLLAKGEVSLFVERLMDEVLRGYLEERFSTPAGKRTTRELCEDLLGLSAPGLDVTAVRDVLEAADLVKFARADLAGEAAHQMAGRVRDLIEATAERAGEPGSREATT